MGDSGARSQVLGCLEEAWPGQDQNTCARLYESSLVEMTRKKTKDLRKCSDGMSACEGTGKVQSEETVAARIVSQIFSLASEPDVEAILVKCDPAIAAHLIGPSASNLESLEIAVGKQVFVRGMPHMQWEDFQVISGSAERIAAQAHPVAVGDRIAAKIEHVHASNPSSGIARVDGFVIDCHHGAHTW